MPSFNLRELRGFGIRDRFSRAATHGVALPHLFFGLLSRANPLTLPALFLVVAYVISTIASVSPNTSLLGSYDRTQGLYTTFSYILIFFLAASTIHSHGQIERAVNVALVASFPVAFYGVIQHYALDPLSWSHGASPGRVASTIGNPAFLGAYLILVIPLTLMRLIAQTEQVAGRVSSARTSGKNSSVLIHEGHEGHEDAVLSKCQKVLGICHPERRPQPERRISHSNAIRDASLRLSMTDRRRIGT